MVTRDYYDRSQSSGPRHHRRQPELYSDESDSAGDAHARQRRSTGRPPDRAHSYAKDADQRRSGRTRGSVYPDDGPSPSSSQVRSHSSAVKPAPVPAEVIKPHGPSRSRPVSSVQSDDAMSSAGAERQNRSRQRFKVRISTPSESSADEGYGHKSREPSDRRAIGGSHKDLERKNNLGNIQFRERRDGYLSDEGQTLKQSRRRRGSGQDSSIKEAGHGSARAGLGDGAKATGGETLSDELPYRPKPRTRSPEGERNRSRGRVPRSRRPPPASDYHEVDREVEGQRQTRINQSRHGSRRAGYYDDDYDEPLRRRPASHRRRDDGRGGIYSPELAQDGEYISDFSRERRGPHYHHAPHDRRYERHDSLPRRNDRYRDCHSDHEDSRYRHGQSQRRSAHDVHGPSEQRYRDKYRSYRDTEHESSHRGYGGKQERGRSNSHGAFGGLPPGWQQDAGRLFMTYGLPYLQKEGPQLLKHAQTYWSKRASSRGGRY